MTKRSHEDAFFDFDPTNCIGDDLPVVAPYVPAMSGASVDAVADFWEAMEIQSTLMPISAPVASHVPVASTSAFEMRNVDDEPIVENLCVAYSSAYDDERCDSTKTERLGCSTPDPMCLVDANAMAVINMLSGVRTEDASFMCTEPLTPHPVATLRVTAPPPLALDRSGEHGCFATRPVGDPPRLGLSAPTPAECAAMLAVPAPDLFQTVKGNHAGLFSEYGGVRAWMASREKALVA